MSPQKAQRKFFEFGDDIKREEEELQEIGRLSQEELKQYVLDGNANWADFEMTNKNPYDFKKLKIRSMRLFEKYKGIIFGKGIIA